MHEDGHTLDMRHNFRSSRVYTQQQLADPEFTKKNGITGSVMEYAPINLNSADEPRERYGTPFNDTLGPYDYWAIEYAYKPLASGLSAADERAALEKIAGRSAEPVAQQRDALDLITGSLLPADSFSVSPALQRKLGADFAERTDAIFGGEGSIQTDYSPSVQVLGLQRSLLAVMMSDTVATRLLESSEKAPSGSGRALRMPELYARLTTAGWR